MRKNITINFKTIAILKRWKKNYRKGKLNELPIQQKIGQFDLGDLLMDFDATSLYPSAMWDDNSIYPTGKSGFSFNVDMNFEIIEKFNSGNFNWGCAILRVKYYNPPDLKLQRLSVKERVQKIEVNRMRIYYIFDNLTSVDIKENIKIGGKK